MASDHVERKLSAILSADVKSYSRLMGEDEAATVRTLTAYRETVSAFIKKHRGRVVDSPGDNMLAEFASVVDALQCAAAIQGDLKRLNADLPPGRRMEFRIGINVGDVIVEGERIYGDGVNIAARLEGLADAGGICVSGSVHDQVEGKLPLQYEFLGEQAVKNIARPIRAYRVLLEPGTAGVERPVGAAAGGWKLRAGAAAVAALLVSGGALWTIQRWVSTLAVNVSPAAKAPLPLPDKPSIAVLPFANLSGDTSQEYFSDGMTEEIITALAKFPGLFVIARNSTFRYKGKAVDIRRVGRELGVGYVLEGSVRKADQRVRVTAQLIDARTEAHKWAERYERPLTDIFALQDEMTERIVSTLVAQVAKADLERALRKGTKDLGAYDYLLRGHELRRRGSKEATFQARRMFEKAIGIDPAYAEAYAGLSGLDGSLPSAYANLGMGLVRQGQHEEGIAAIEKAISLNPNDAASYINLAGAVTFAGKPTEAIRLVKKAMRLDPFYPPLWDFILGRAHFYLRQHEKALPPLKASTDRAPNSWSFHAFLAATYAHLGRQGEARAEIAQVRRLWPDVTVRKIGELGAIYKYKEFLEHYLEGLRKAGLPE
ncbi:MAG: adenylate/guanylate cyclase domain-containing protein [Candidatus Tectomicrobia bacterium]|nr:adenylate/guanylate cyclase domain-containing protein [Candidatus Tectomicrobia bacterium]